MRNGRDFARALFVELPAAMVVSLFLSCILWSAFH
jgi:hypothetical protein